MVVVEQFDRSREQRMAALRRANEVRTTRARLKEDVQAGRVPYDVFLTDGPHDPLLRSMRLEEALRNMPGIGEVLVRYILRDAQISPSKTLGGLSPQAWRRLYTALEAYPSIHRRLSEASRNVMP